MSELVSRIAERIEPLIDQRPMIDASQSEIRRIQAQTIARVAAKVAQESFEALEARADKAEAKRDAANYGKEGLIGQIAELRRERDALREALEEARGLILGANHGPTRYPRAVALLLGEVDREEARDG